MFIGSFTLPSAQDVEFQLGSDDDSFIYVDGTLAGQEPGRRPVTNIDFTANGLAAGSHTVEVFYADREQSVAYLSLNLLTPNVVITPPGVTPTPTPTPSPMPTPIPEPASVPEPMTVSLFATALAVLFLLCHRSSSA